MGDLIDKQFYFDGKTITLYDKDHNVYGVLAVPPDIESALAKANKEFGVRVALTDLASPKLGDVLNQRIKDAVDVGLHKVRGVPATIWPLTGTWPICRSGSKPGINRYPERS